MFAGYIRLDHGWKFGSSSSSEASAGSSAGGLVSSANSSGASAGGDAYTLGGSPVSPMSSSLVQPVPPSARIRVELKTRVQSTSMRRIGSLPWSQNGPARTLVGGPLAVWSDSEPSAHRGARADCRIVAGLGLRAAAVLPRAYFF